MASYELATSMFERGIKEVEKRKVCEKKLVVSSAVTLKQLEMILISNTTKNSFTLKRVYRSSNSV